MRHVFGPGGLDLIGRIRNYLTSDIIVSIDDPKEYSLVEESAVGGALSGVGNETVHKLIFHHGSGSYVRWRDQIGRQMEIKRLSSDRFRVAVSAPPIGYSWWAQTKEFDIDIGQFLQVKDSRGRWLSVTRIRHRHLKIIELIK